ncbi:hypothetical protein SEA_TINYMINY_86 [Microbacterium phage TinyMiny]|nr:hypothetical protein SEA_TINYMINY_86 [Microbacterium phage TinyMiny]
MPKKKQRSCNYIKPHESHTWRRESGQAVWCPGVVSKEHVHMWDNGAHMPIMRDLSDGHAYVLHSRYDDEGEYWQGAFECPCGKSAFLKNGRKMRIIKPGAPVERFPNADHLTRLRELKEKLDAGGEEALTEEDKAELQALATALIEALQPLVAAFTAMAEAALAVMADFMDHIDKAELERLSRLAQAFGEKVETGPVPIQVVDYDPMGASQHVATSIVEDALQPNLAPDPTDPVEVARKAIAEPFKEPFRISDLEPNVVHHFGGLQPRADIAGFVQNNMPADPLASSRTHDLRGPALDGMGEVPKLPDHIVDFVKKNVRRDTN